MVTEATCQDVTACLFQATSRIDDQAQAHSLPNHVLYRRLLGRYSISSIDDALRWLEVGAFVGRSGFGLPVAGLPFLYFLTDKGIAYAETGILLPDDRRLLYTEDPYRVFVARQFQSDDDPLFAALSSKLEAAGFAASEGRVDGLNAFRGEIISKIRRARLFICLLTRREALATGRFASSVWLYQETGAAIALGKKPLLLVETGMHPHYAGELQKTDEYIEFDRSDFGSVLPEVIRRIHGELTVNHIPLPLTRPI